VKREKKIPTILGIVLVVTLGGTLFLLKKRGIIRIGAGEEEVPREVRVTNVTDSSFVVSWVTSKPTTGLINLSSGNLDKLFYDLRDPAGDLPKLTTHYVKVEGLESNHQYQFVVISGGESFENSQYQVETALPISGDLPTANLASGVVKTEDDFPAEGAIVYLSISGVAPLSSLVTSQGNWAVSLATAFSADLTGLAQPQEGTTREEIFVQGAEKGTARAIVYAQDDNPVPVIVLGEEYDFTNQGSEELTPTPTSAPAAGSRLDEFEPAASQKEFEILSPDDGETVSFSRPEIFGTGPEGGIVEISLESANTYQARVEIDQSGEWRWSPPQDLTPGSHTLTVNYLDPETGALESFVRSFVVAAADDDEPSFQASPSATIIPTTSPTATPTEAVTPTPSPLASATATLTATPTSPPRTSQPSTETAVPQLGFWEPTAVLVISSILLFLFFVSVQI